MADKEAFWRGVVERFARSGLTVREFCARERLSEPSFYWWKRELKGRPPMPAFVPVAVALPAEPTVGSEPRGPALEVTLRGGYVLRLPGPLDRKVLADLVAALEGRPC